MGNLRGGSKRSYSAKRENVGPKGSDEAVVRGHLVKSESARAREEPTWREVGGHSLRREYEVISGRWKYEVMYCGVRVPDHIVI